MVLPTLPQWLQIVGTAFAGGAVAYVEQHLTDLGTVSWKVVALGALTAGVSAIIHKYTATPAQAVATARIDAIESGVKS